MSSITTTDYIKVLETSARLAQVQPSQDGVPWTIVDAHRGVGRHSDRPIGAAQYRAKAFYLNYWT